MDILQKLSSTALRILPEEQFASMRSRYMNARSRFNPLLQRIHGTFDSADLRTHLESTVGGDFEILMVHSSVNHMLPMYTDNPLELIKMLVEFCGEQRTLVMPGFFFGDPKIGSVRKTLEANPRFNLRRTASQVGLATELFRRFPGVVQSRHPVFRVSARGPLAQELIAGHESAGTSCGTGTPFDFMAKHDTLILGIGKHSHVLTQVHHTEDVMGDDFPVPRKQGEGLDFTMVDGDFECPMHIPVQGFARPRDMYKVPALLGPDVLKEWRFHNVPLFAARANAVSTTLMAAARQGRTLFPGK